MLRCNFCGFVTLEYLTRPGFCPSCWRLAHAEFPQHDDHCEIKADGWVWLIHEIIQPNTLLIWRVDDNRRTVTAMFDISGIDWESYCNKAVANINAQAAGLAVSLSGPAEAL